DGKINGRYTDMRLHKGRNTTGVCEDAETYQKEHPEAKVATVIQNGGGKLVLVDCKALAEKLAVLVDIAERLPPTRFLARPEGTPISSSPPTAEDFFAYHLVDHMITVLLIGNVPAETPFYQLFDTPAYDIYTENVHRIGEEIKTATPFRVDGAESL